MEPIHESPSFRNRRRYFSFFRCFSSSGKSSNSFSLWQKIRTESARLGGGSLWSRGLRKIREWSEAVAGRRWKMLLRRFRRQRDGNRHVNSRYDPLSYALNFDDGQGQNDDFDDGGEDGYYASRNFSSRYANGSMDFSQGGPTATATATATALHHN